MRLVNFTRDEAEAIYDLVKDSIPGPRTYFEVEAANNLAEVFGLGVRLKWRPSEGLIEQVRA